MANIHKVNSKVWVNLDAIRCIVVGNKDGKIRVFGESDDPIVCLTQEELDRLLAAADGLRDKIADNNVDFDKGM